MDEKEYIERKAAIKEAIAERDLHSPFTPELSGWRVGAEKVANRLASLPAADVRPVVRGEWMPGPSDTSYCSACGEPEESRYNMPNFCPNCGADMRGGA